MVVYIPPIMLIVEPRLAIIILARSPIYFNHLSFGIRSWSWIQPRVIEYKCPIKTIYELGTISSISFFGNGNALLVQNKTG